MCTEYNSAMVTFESFISKLQIKVFDLELVEAKHALQLLTDAMKMSINITFE